MSLERLAAAALCCTAIAGLAPASALASGAWLPAEKLTGADAVAPQVGVFPDGEAIALWGPHAFSADEAAPNAAQVTVRPAGGEFGPPRPLSVERAVSPVLAIGPGGNAAAAWYGEGAQHIALRPLGGEFGPSAQDAGGRLDLAIDGAGNAYSLVMRADQPASGEWSYRYAVITVPADGGPVTERDVAEQADMIGGSLAADAAGTVTVAWRGIRDGETWEQSHVFTSTAAAGMAFSEPSPVSNEYYDDGQPTHTLANARGDTLVLWAGADHPNLYGGGIRFQQVVRGSFRPAGGEFQPEERVEVPNELNRGVSAVDAAMTPDGNAVIAWTNNITVSMTYRPRSGGFETAHTPAPFPVCCSGEYLAQNSPSVALDGAGNAAVAYTSDTPDTTRLLVVRRPRGRAFEPPQSAYAARHIFAPDLGFDALGRGTLVWSPQEHSSTEPSRTDVGIYTSGYDPDALPRLTRIRPQLRLGRFGLEATDQGRVTLTVRRRGGHGRVVSRRPRVVPGYNPVPLKKAERRRLSRPGRYVATASLTDRAGHRSRTIRRTFPRGP